MRGSGLQRGDSRTVLDESAFSVTLRKADWDSTVSAWRQDVLRLPGVKIDGYFAWGKPITDDWFKLEPDRSLLIWRPHGDPERPDEVTLHVRFVHSAVESLRKMRRMFIVSLTALIVASAVIV